MAYEAAIKISTVLEADEAQSIKNINSQLTTIGNGLNKVKVGVELDESDLQLNTKSLAGKIDLTGVTGAITVTADTAKSASAIKAQLSTIENIINSDSSIKLKVDFDTAYTSQQAQTQAKTISTQLQNSLNQVNTDFTVNIDSEAIENIKKQLLSLDFNEESANAFIAQMEEMNVQAGKLTANFTQVGDGAQELKSVTLTGVDNLQRQVTIAETLYNVENKETGEMEQQAVISTKIADNYNEQRAALESNDAYLSKASQSINEIISRSENVTLFGDDIINLGTEVTNAAASLSEFTGQTTKFTSAQKQQIDSIVSGVKSYVTNAETMVSTLEAKFAELAKTYTEINNLSAKLATTDISTAVGQELTTQLQTARTNAQGLESDITGMVSANQNLTTYFNQFVASLKSASSESSAIKSGLTEVNNVTASAVQYSNKMQSALNGVVNSTNTLNSVQAKVRDQFAETDAKLSSMSSTASSLKTVLSNAFGSVSEAPQNLVNQVANLETKLNELSSALANVDLNDVGVFQTLRTQVEQAGTEVDTTITAINASIKTLQDNAAYVEKALSKLSEYEQQASGATSRNALNAEHYEQVVAVINELTTQLNAYKNSSVAMTSDVKAGLESQIASVKQLVKEYQNAETVSVELRTKTVEVVGNEQVTKLETYVKKLENAGLMTDSITSDVEQLRAVLSQTFTNESITEFLNGFDKLKVTVKDLQAEVTGLESKYIELAKTYSEINNISEKMLTTDPTSTTYQVMNTQLEELKVNAAALEQEINDTVSASSNLKGFGTQMAQEFNEAASSSTAIAVGLKEVEDAEAMAVTHSRSMDAALKSVKSTSDSLKMSQAGLADEYVEVVKSLSTMGTSIDNIKLKMSQLNNVPEELRTRVQQLEASFQELKSTTSNLNTDEEMQASVVEADRLDTEIKQINKSLAQLKSESNSINLGEKFSSSLSKAQADLQTVARQWSALFSDSSLSSSFTELQTKLETVKNSADLSKWRSEFSSFKSEVKAAGLNVQSFTDQIKSNIAKVTQWASATTVLYGSLRLIRTALEEIIDLDTAMIDLYKTTDATESEYQEFYETANDVAIALGATTEEIISMTAEWSRLGYAIDEASELAEASAIFASISPDMDTDTATEGLVSIVKAFGIETDEVMDGVISKINSVGNSFAVSNDDIVTALEKSSSAMAAANNTLDETVALATAANEIVQDADTVGTALKTISMRIRGYDEDTETYSEDVAVLTGEIADLTKVASNSYAGISLFEEDDPDTYRSTYDILKDISEIWDEMTDANQAELLEVLFGKRQSQVGAALLSNFEQAEAAIETMADSAGSAEAEMDVIYQSLEYKLNALQETWVGVAQNLLDSDMLKTIVDGLTTVSGVVDTFTEKLGLLGTISITGTVTSLIKLLTSASKINTSVQNVLSKLTEPFDSTSTASVNQYSAALSTLGTQEQNLMLKSLSLSEAEKELLTTRAKQIAIVSNMTVGEFAQAAGLDTQTVATQLGATASEKMTTTLIKQALADETLSAGIDTATASQLEQNAAMSAGTTTASTYKGAISAMLSTTMGKISLVTAGITAVITLVTAAWNAYQDYITSINETASEAIDSYSETAESVEDYQSQIEELKESLDSGNLSEEEAYEVRSELVSIQEEVIEALGLEADAFDLLGDSIEDVNSVFSEYTATEALNAITEGWEGFNQAVTQMSKESNWGRSLFANGNAIFDIDSGDLEYLEKVKDIFEEVFGDDVSFVEDTNGDIEYYLSVNAEDAVDGLSQVNILMNELEDESGIDLSAALGINSWESVISDSMNAAQEVLDEYQETYDWYIELQIVANYSDVMDQVETLQEQMSEAVIDGADDDILAAYSAMNDYLSEENLISIGVSADDEGVLEYFSEYLEDFNAQYADNVNEIEFAVTVEGDDEYKEWLEEAIAVFEDSEGYFDSTLFISIAEGLVDATGDQETAFNRLNTVMENYGFTASELITILEEQELATIDATESVDHLTSQYDSFSSSLETIEEAADVVADALSEQAESGSLSIDTYEELIALGDDYADCLVMSGDAITLNEEKVEALTEALRQTELDEIEEEIEACTEQWKENADAILEMQSSYDSLTDDQQEELETLQEENSQLADNISQYEALATSILYASSAYQEYVNSVDTDKDKVEEATEALQLINDVLFNSDNTDYKIGDETFTNAVSWLFPDEISSSDIDTIEAYMKKLQSYLVFDDDEITGLNIYNFLEDAVEAGIMEVNDSGIYEVIGEQTYESIADALGLSVDLVEAFFTEINRNVYGGDAYTVTSSSAENALLTLQELIEARNELNELEADVDVDDEDLIEAQEKVNELLETLTYFTTEDLATIGITIDEETGDLLYWLSDTEYINLSAELDESSIEEVAEEIESTAEELGVEVEVSVDTDTDSIEEVEEAVDELDGSSIDIDTDVDTTDISDANNELGLLGDRSLSSTVTVEADTEEYEEIMSDIESAEYTATVTLTTDQTIYNEQINAAMLSASSKLSGTATIQTSTDDSDLTIAVDADTTAAEKEIDKLNDIDVEVEVSANTDDAESALEDLEEKLSVDVANVEVQLNTTEAEEDLLALAQKVDTVDATVDVDAETSDAVANVSSLEIAISKIEPKTVKIKANVVGQSALNTMKNTIDSIKNKTVTITTKTVTTSSTSSLVSVANGTTSGMSYASGTAYKSGSATANKTTTALVGELGPEILVDRNSGTWKTIGDAGAEFATIHKGDIVFSAEQTRALLANGAINGRGTSYAEGTAYASTVTTALGITQSAAKAASSSSSSSSSVSSAANSVASAASEVADSASSLDDTLEELQEEFDSLIENYEHQIYMLEHEGGTTEEIIAVYQKMQDEVTAQLAEYRSLGADENSDYIQQLEEDYYEYADEIVSLTVSIYEDAVSELENAITLNENWLENAINSGDTESAEEYTETIIQLYKDMQEEIHEEAEYYRSLGYSETSDEISELSDLWWDYADSIAEAMATLYSEIIEEHENYLSLMENWMTNSISYGNLDQAKEYTDEMIAEYQAIQDALHEEAEYYRSLGYSDTSDEVSELSDLWWDYEYEIIELMASYYEAVVEQNENAITLLQYSLDDAISDADYSSISEYTRAIQSYYQDMLDAIEEEVEYYLSLGYAETSSEVTELLTLWQSYADEMSSVISDAWDSVVDNASDALDDIQGYYDTLTNAAQEFAESGFITVDTFQEILSYGVEYLAYLQDENGYLVINEESIQAVIAARTEQLAVESALAYVEELKEAVIAGDTAQLLYLTQATEAAASSTWDLVYAQLEFLGLDDETYANALARINALRSLCDTAISSIGQATGQVTDALEEQLDLLEEQEDALDELLDYVMDMVEQMVENEIEALEDMIDAYQEIVDLQKESLELEQEKDEYTKTVAEKEEAIAELQQQIALLSLDDSREAAAEKAELEEELAELQEELADYISDYAYDAAEDTLDSMADAYEAEKNEEIETLEESISSTQKIYEMAIAYIDECWDTLYTDLMEWNYEYGTVTSDEIQSAWDSASTAVESYGSYLEAVLATTEAIADVTAQIEAIESGTTTTVSYSSTSTDEETGETTSSYDTSGGEYTSAAQSIVAQMKANASAWWSADESGQEELAEQNETLAAQLSSIIGREVVKDGDGVWHLDSTSGAVLFETEPFASYHTGGIVTMDDDTLKDDEVFAKLQEGEAVFTTAQIESLEHILDMIDMIPRMTDAIDSLYANTIASNSIMDGLTQTSGNYENIVTDNSSSINVAPVITIEYTGSGTTEEEFASLSQTLSDTVITNINNAFAKKGKLPLAKGLKA